MGRVGSEPILLRAKGECDQECVCLVRDERVLLRALQPEAERKRGRQPAFQWLDKLNHIDHRRIILINWDEDQGSSLVGSACVGLRLLCELGPAKRKVIRIVALPSGGL